MRGRHKGVRLFQGQGEEQEGEDFMSDVMAVVKRTGTSRTLPSGLIITPVR